MEKRCNFFLERLTPILEIQVDLNQPNQENNMKINNFGPELTPAQIEILEAETGILLPKDYREFLLICNGGIPNQDKNIVDIPEAPGSPTDVQVFFGIGRAVHSSDIKWNITLIKERCSDDDLIPIACDSGGNIFCLRPNKDKHDVIYFDLDAPNPPCYFIASSFSAFIEKLRSF
ncbi:MAG: hypothetical protein C0490_13620 [Marivirga sp.]|nr:hypothetical protein [Marivirga sp.]